MARIIGLVLSLIVLVFGLFLGILNSDPVPINFYLGSRDIPLSLLLVLILLIGTIIGVIASLGVVIKLKRQISRLRKEIKSSEAEVKNLRSIPIKDES